LTFPSPICLDGDNSIEGGTAVKLSLAAVIVAVTMFTLNALQPSTLASSPALQARDLTVLVGGGQDTMQLLNFFPMSVRIRTGDTVTWRINADELHTTSFVKGVTQWGPIAIQFPLGAPGEMIPGFAAPIPGGPPEAIQFHPQVAFPTRAPGAPMETYSGIGNFVSSGVLARQPVAPGAPPNEVFSARFDTPGMYMYVCLVHPDRMIGWVEVAPADALNVPDQAAIEVQANAEIAQMLHLLQVAEAQGNATVRSEPAPNGTDFWYARAGSQEFESGDARAQVMDFLPRNLTVRSGDTVVWGTNYFHTVSFIPNPPSPEFIQVIPQPNGPPLLPLNPQVVFPAKPSATYDPSQFFNSGIIGPFLPPGNSWALTFDRPGTYEYVCLVHELLGMKGTITVVAR
jgi:plastocyanin